MVRGAFFRFAFCIFFANKKISRSPVRRRPAGLDGREANANCVDEPQMSSISRLNSSSGSGISTRNSPVAPVGPVEHADKVAARTPPKQQARFEELAWVRRWGPDTVDISEQARALAEAEKDESA